MTGNENGKIKRGINQESVWPVTGFAISVKSNCVAVSFTPFWGEFSKGLPPNFAASASQSTAADLAVAVGGAVVPPNLAASAAQSTDVWADSERCLRINSSESGAALLDAFSALT